VVEMTIGFYSVLCIGVIIDVVNAFAGLRGRLPGTR